jgi:uncharacterized protein (TIGR02996 family)
VIGYVANGPRTHAITTKQPGEAIRVVERTLRACSDCDGASEWNVNVDVKVSLGELGREGGRYGEHTGRPLPPLGELVDRIAWRYEMQCVWLRFDFLLQQPGYGMLPYRGTVPRRAYASTLEVGLYRDRASGLAVSLFWPFTTVTDLFLQSHDEVFGMLGVLPRPTCWVTGTPEAQKHRRWVFDRGALVPPHEEESGQRLREQVFADPTDGGARLAYADWLLAREDPLGEMLVLQHQIAALAPGDDRAPALVERSRALLAAHGLRWSHVLVPRW